MCLLTTLNMILAFNSSVVLRGIKDYPYVFKATLFANMNQSIFCIFAVTLSGMTKSTENDSCKTQRVLFHNSRQGHMARG